MTRLLHDIHAGASAALEIPLDLADDYEEDACSELTPSVANNSLNLILVTNLNIRVVLCDCGRAYRMPDCHDVDEGGGAACDLDLCRLGKAAAAGGGGEDEANNNTVGVGAVVALPPEDGIKERY